MRIHKLQNSDGFVLLSQPPYLNFTLSVLFSQLGFNMMNVVLLFLVFTLTQSSFSVAMLIMTYLIPQVLLSFVEEFLLIFMIKNRF